MTAYRKNRQGQVLVQIENISMTAKFVNEVLQGSHSDWKIWKTWKNGKAGNFEQTGKVRENHTKYWKTEIN